MKNFYVKDNTLRNKATNHQKRLMMNCKTEAYEVNDETFPTIMFSFLPFSEIAKLENPDHNPFFGKLCL